MAKTPQVGEQAPDFELPGTDGTFKLSDHRGERVVLLFYPGDNTTGLHQTVLLLPRPRRRLRARSDATVVGISAQDLESHEEFTAKHSPHGAAARRRRQAMWRSPTALGRPAGHEARRRS